ncbi:hypothetical protein ACF07Y_42710 [Streptomyces sp. NPDC016566]|uniref:hypothetical protein n=1 Tax=Streptomyces sp. NPDC016566 TaxID=3364967 RepID=UPI0036F7A5CE
MVRRFRATASPAAYALAQRLAAVPLNLPVMRLIQQALPDTQFWNLTEIMLLGLVRRTPDSHLYTAFCTVSGPYLARANRLGRLLQRAGGPRPARQSPP